VILVVVQVLAGCGQAESPIPTYLIEQTTPTLEPTPKNPNQDRIQRVENGLVPMTETGDFDWGNSESIFKQMEQNGVPGVSIAIIQDFKIDWAKGYGVMEARGNQPVTSDTLFNAGSIAKPVSAAVALMLVEQGLLILDQDVNDNLVSWYVEENQFTVEEKVTLRRLLSHSSGLTDGLPMRSSSEPEFDWFTSAEGEKPTVSIQQLLEAQPPADEGVPTRVTNVPGESYQYSNFGYGVLQLLMTDVTGIPFPKLMEDTILDPLGMNSSTFEQPLPMDLRERATTEHDVTGQPFPDKRHHYPILAAGGLWTTPSDLALFAIEIIRAYAGESDFLLSKDLVQEMLSPQVMIRNDEMRDSFGLGVELAGQDQELHFMHSGGTWGSTCILWIYPETGQGAVVMTNSASKSGAIRFEILISIAAEYDWPISQ
jgi:CubicO group peptidase (beta-lactamase class C family)